MRLLLDEMYSPEIARQLQAKGRDVQSIQGDRQELRAADDAAIAELMGEEGRAVVTNNVSDFMPIHTAWVSEGRSHAGMVFSVDRSMHRSLATIGLWVRTLDRFLADHPAPDALRGRVHFLVPVS